MISSLTALTIFLLILENVCYSFNLLAGVITVMCSYNRIGGVYSCENNETMSHIRDVMGFKGWIISDWDATHTTSQSLLAGLI